MCFGSIKHIDKVLPFMMIFKCQSPSHRTCTLRKLSRCQSTPTIPRSLMAFAMWQHYSHMWYLIRDRLLGSVYSGKSAFIILVISKTSRRIVKSVDELPNSIRNAAAYGRISSPLKRSRSTVPKAGIPSSCVILQVSWRAYSRFF